MLPDIAPNSWDKLAESRDVMMFDMLGWLACPAGKGLDVGWLKGGMLRLKLKAGAGGWTGWDWLCFALLTSRAAVVGSRSAYSNQTISNDHE